MTKIYKTPGVYIEEVSFRPSSVAQVETAIPAFIGYTEKAEINGQPLLHQAIKINSSFEYQTYFGGDFIPKFVLIPKVPQDPYPIQIGNQEFTLQLKPNQRVYLFQAVQDFFQNNGRSCYILSVGTYGVKEEVKISKESLLGISTSNARNPKPKGLKALEDIREPSILVIPDAVGLGLKSGEVYQEMLRHCQAHGNRFSIFDLPNGFEELRPSDDCISQFRTSIGDSNLSFGAAYYPWLDRIQPANCFSYKNLDPSLNLRDILPEAKAKEVFDWDQMTPENLHLALWNTSLTYQRILESMRKILKPVPTSGAIAGIYSMMDRTKGVWKSPANVSLTGFEKPSVSITSQQQMAFNVHSSGKSINALRLFPGQGTVIWGARTLAGNDPEWKYVPVKRTALMIKGSIENSISQFVFEPNNANTWARVKLIVSGFLFGLWRQGAFWGSKADESYFVKIGLGETMTEQDIVEGKGILIIGFALIKPAEFQVLKIGMAFG